MRIGVLSDTHGLLRPEVIDALSGCDLILHGGDINQQAIIDHLSEIAPLKVVRGNNDKEWADALPLYLDFFIGSIRVYMTHKKKDLPTDLSPYDLVVIGHSHKYSETCIGNTIVLNPGSCVPRRFDQAITLAFVESEGRQLRIQKIEILHQK